LCVLSDSQAKSWTRALDYRLGLADVFPVLSRCNIVWHGELGLCAFDALAQARRTPSHNPRRPRNSRACIHRIVFVHSSQVTYSKHDQIRGGEGVSTAEVLACHLNVSRWTRCKAYVSHRRDHSMQRQALTTCPIGSVVKNGCMGSAKDYLAAPLCRASGPRFPRSVKYRLRPT
jgi:hypothetical protein